jgi:hypothetical protein
MKAKITYRMARIVHPWDANRRKEMEEAWCLMKTVTPEYGNPTEEPVALFNLDSEAITFQGHLLACAGPESPIEPDAGVARFLTHTKTQ